MTVLMSLSSNEQANNLHALSRLFSSEKKSAACMCRKNVSDNGSSSSSSGGSSGSRIRCGSECDFQQGSSAFAIGWSEVHHWRLHTTNYCESFQQTCPGPRTPIFKMQRC